MAEVARTLNADGQVVASRFFDRNGNGQIRNDDRMDWVPCHDGAEYAAELLSSYPATIRLENRYENDNSLAIGSIETQNGFTVSYMGCGVFRHDHSRGIDNDSIRNPVTATTTEMRRFSDFCLNQFATTTLVIGTGQPGIGKTRGALYFSLKALLWRGFVVLRVSYNSGSVHLFLPDGDGVYHVWEGTATDWHRSAFAKQQKGVFALIDPPEDPNYRRSARCNVLEFASNHQERHLKNAYKHGLIRIMKMPSLSEILCLEPLLWTTKSEPSIDTPLSAEDRRRVLEDRCFLVGCVTRVVFNNEVFHKQLRAVARGAKNISAEMGFRSLFALYAEGIAEPETSGFEFPSRYFLMEASDDERSISFGRLNSVSIYHLRNELGNSVADYTGAVAFAFEDVCSKFLKGGTWNGTVFPPRKIVVGANLQDTTTLIQDSTALIFQGQPGFVVRASSCYPILDFAFSDTRWFNAKVGQSQVKISLSAFVTLMLDLNFAQIDGANFALTGPPPDISLTMIRNSDVSTFVLVRAMARRYQQLDVDQIERIFEETVTVSFLNTAEWAPNDVLNSRAELAGELLQRYPPPDSG